ncbi:hypothetical protein OQA88_6232 [Cercophora sp. LCS_1]
MFRRHWSGLPADPVFPTDLFELGYFIHNSDEIREVEDPDNYIKYAAISKIIISRLTALGLESLRLPLGSAPSEPHVPVYMSKNISIASRVVIVFGEPRHPFGYISGRVVKGEGGIDKGSMVGLTRGVLGQASSSSDSSPPGILLANTGELWWWPEGKRSLTQVSRQNIPMPSAVHTPRRHDDRKNSIQSNRTVAEHIQYVFEKVIPTITKNCANLDVIAAGDAADEVERYLNNDQVWKKIGGRMNSLAVMGGFFDSKDVVCHGFKEFMQDRGRAYIIHQSELDTMIAGPRGNPAASVFTMFGCPSYSAGENCNMIELILSHAQPALLKWIQQVAMKGAAYKNMEPDVVGDGSGVSPEQMQQFMNTWAGAAEATANGAGPIIHSGSKKGSEQDEGAQNGIAKQSGADSTAVQSPEGKSSDVEGVTEAAKNMRVTAKEEEDKE